MSIEVSASNIKSIAKNLKAALSDYKLDLKHSHCLEILSKAFGYKDWNTLSAKLNGASQSQTEERLVDEAGIQESSNSPPSEPVKDEIAWDAIYSEAIKQHDRFLKEKLPGSTEVGNKKSLVFRSNIAIDLGTANTLVFLHKKGIVIQEPTVVAVRSDSAGNPKILAVGNEAKSMMGRTPGSIQAIRPMRDGVIANFDVATEVMRQIIKKIQNTGSMLKFRPRVILAIPSGSTQIEKRTFKESLEKAGAREVLLVESPIAAAIGAGLPVTKSSGSMIVDIGAGITEVAVISLGGIVYSRSHRVGGDMMDETIIRHFKKQHNLLIAATTAEQIKIGMGSAYPLKEMKSMEVTGRDLLTGRPKSLTVNSDEIRECLADNCDQIVDSVQDALQDTPPKLVADIKKSGIVLTGGGSLLYGMDLLLRDRFDIPITYAEDPLSCCALGAGAMLDNIDLLKSVTIQ
jgi:rod shape-determining protein MreB and related proteins